MKRFLVILIIFFLGVMYCSEVDNSLLVFAENISDKTKVDTSKIEQQIILFEEDFLDEILSVLCLDNLSKFYIEDRVIIEGYTNEFKDYNVINGRKINVQISISEGECIMGYPLIENSF